ncbi:sialate O-acetylesterase [Tellurirhabdus rosea]|uniref:sialate O-acetylesterase n=1 Tax=Tellurirhabdus rosea TaxID=2674997 RepID=UPI0022512799|nr:sialate O-acetylesterase [Tellurirhabdus rosea]
MKINLPARLFILVSFLLTTLPGFSQIAITYPSTRAVFQRDRSDLSTISINGTYSQPINRVEARLVMMGQDQGTNTDWTTIQNNPQGGIFQGNITGKGGWYRLEVRAFLNTTLVGQAAIDRIGIGEVFIITGQSNAQGFQDKGAAGASDDRVNTITYDNTVANSLDDPPSPTFRHLDADALIGPRGQSAWCWGILGDLIARQYNVPVLFINTAWAGTTIKSWEDSSKGLPGKNIFQMGTPFENYPTGMPYGNLLIALRYYVSLQGLRAVLWQQGETDNVPLRVTQEEYRNSMQYIINKTRADTKRYPAWILARSSYNQGETSQAVINAQNAVINTFNNNVYAGPSTDNLQVPRPDGVHFGGDGLRLLAEAWFASMDANFFSRAIPLKPLPSPEVTVTCDPSNQGLTLRVKPEITETANNATITYQFQDITWSNGQKGTTLSVTAPGKYSAIAKDEKGTTFILPELNVTGALQPTVPALLPSGQQQVCSDSVLTLSTNSPVGNAIVWNTGVNARTLKVGNPGNYTARAVNVYGCSSASSAPVSLVVQPKLPTPALRQVGAYTLRDTLNGAGFQFDWRLGSQLISNQSAVEIKALQPGQYSARTKKVYTLGSSNLTCYSNFSAPLDYQLPAGNKGLTVYPNPSPSGRVAVETRENLTNAEVSVYTLFGQHVFSKKFEKFDARQFVDLSVLLPGQYIIQVRGAGFNQSSRIMVK